MHLFTDRFYYPGMCMAMDQGIVVILKIEVLKSINIKYPKSRAVFHKSWKRSVKRHTPGISPGQKSAGFLIQLPGVRPFGCIGRLAA